MFFLAEKQNVVELFLQTANDLGTRRFFILLRSYIKLNEQLSLIEVMNLSEIYNYFITMFRVEDIFL